MNYQLLVKRVLVALFALSLFVAPVNGYAQSNPGNPGNPGMVSPGARTAVTIPSASTPFSLDITACRLTFNWAKYISDQKAGNTSSNPYIDQGCVTQKDAFENGTVKVAKYSDFAVGSATAKAAFGTDPVMGIVDQNLDVFNSAGTTKLADAPSYNRSQNTRLNTVFPASYLQNIYRANSGVTDYYIPRFFWTGPDQFGTNSQGQEVYYGGPCKIENGRISVRTNYAGRPLNSVNWGFQIDPSKPLETCALNRNVTNPRVEERSLLAYQYLFEVKYPTTTQCAELNTIFNYGSEGCLAFYRRSLGGVLNGSPTTGNRIVATYTYFSSYDDGGAARITSSGSVSIYNFLGWVNPDVNGVRKTAASATARGYDGYSTYVY